MLYFSFKDPSGDVSWHVGEPVEISLVDIRLVTMIQADEEELMYVRDNMVNLPHALSLSDRWYGDQAKQIAFMLLTKGYEKIAIDLRIKGNEE